MNDAAKSVEYFTNLGEKLGKDEYRCPELSNPCDFFMSMMSKESIEFDKEEKGDQSINVEQAYEEKIKELVDYYESSPEKNKHD